MKYGVIPKLQFSSCIKIKDCLYFYSVDKKVFLQNRIGTSECTYLSEFIVDGEYIHNIDSMRFYGGRIYMLDVSGRYLIIYELESRKYRIMNLQFNVKPYQNYAGAELLRNELVVFSYTKNEIAIIDLETERISKSYSYDGEPISSTIMANNKVYGFNKKGRMICYDSENGFIERVGPKMEFKMISNLLLDNSVYYLDVNANLKKYYFDSEEVEDMHISISEKDSINSIIATKRKVWFLPKNTQNIICWDGQKMEVFSGFPDDYGYLGVHCHKFWGYAEDYNKIYIAQQAVNYMIIIDKTTGDAEFIKPNIDSNDYMNLMLSRNEPMIETEDVGLNLFMDCVRGIDS